MDNITLIILLVILLLLIVLAVIIVVLLLVRAGYVTLSFMHKSSDRERVTGAIDGNDNETIHQPQVGNEQVIEHHPREVTSQRTQENDNIPPSVQYDENCRLQFSDERTAIYENSSYSTLRNVAPLHSPINNTNDMPPSPSQPEEKEPVYDIVPPTPIPVRHPLSPEPIYDKPPHPAPGYQMEEQLVHNQSVPSPKPVPRKRGNQPPTYDQLPPKPKQLHQTINDTVYDKGNYSHYKTLLPTPKPVYDEQPSLSGPVYAEQSNFSPYDTLPFTSSRPVHSEVVNDTVYDRLPPTSRPVHSEKGNDTVYDRLPPTSRPVHSEVNDTVYDRLPHTSRPVHSEVVNDTVYDRLPSTSRPVHSEVSDTVYDRLPPTSRPVHSEVNDTVYDRLPPTSRPVHSEVVSEEPKESMYDQLPKSPIPFRSHN
ncbi:hypothetical protein Pmani_012054 [Petrolisthes manimaculis]|uniref:Uncharacterized protein n=1 Tax=Petrolisthes manimaculis TaxID=1843537 RepID=A0AAE1PZC4_9EUCA|nr:hypothetical protein Pmani_012054 [Petrolisthes manimaculis]